LGSKVSLQKHQKSLFSLGQAYLFVRCFIFEALLFFLKQMIEKNQFNSNLSLHEAETAVLTGESGGCLAMASRAAPRHAGHI
jgi:hypothetical protein